MVSVVAVLVAARVAVTLRVAVTTIVVVVVAASFGVLTENRPFGVDSLCGKGGQAYENFSKNC